MKITVIDQDNRCVDIITTSMENIEEFVLSDFNPEVATTEFAKLHKSEMVDIYLTGHCNYNLENCDYIIDYGDGVMYNLCLTHESFES